MRKIMTELNARVDDQPEIQELKIKLIEAESELVAAQAELEDLSAILNPPLATSVCTPTITELEALKAGQQLPFARERYLIAKASVLEIRPTYERARGEALKACTDARSRARLPILRKFADALDDAKAIGDELLAFDQETVRLGGSPAGHPFPEFQDELPYREGWASCVRRIVKELEQRA